MIYLFMKEFSAIMIMYKCYFYPSIFMICMRFATFSGVPIIFDFFHEFYN